MRKIVYYGISIVLMVFTLSAIVAFFEIISRNGLTTNLVYLLAGILGYFTISQVLYKKFDYTPDFAETFAHELTHALFALLFFNKIESFFVHSRDGGYVTYRGNRNPFISLSPYFFPVFTYALLLVKLIAEKSIQNYLIIMIGITIAFHVRTMRKQFHNEQQDLIIYPRLLTNSFVSFGYVISYGNVIIQSVCSFGGWRFIKEIFLIPSQLYQYL